MADLLTESRIAHEDYRHAKPRYLPKDQVTLPGSPTAARAALERAYSARANAEMLDPNTTDPAWGDDIWLGIHYDLLKFYSEQLAH